MAKSRKSRSRSRRSKKAPMRSFTVEAAKDSNGKVTNFANKDYSGRYLNRNPAGAAKKAATQLCRDKKVKGTCVMTLHMRETTQNSKHKVFRYKLTRKKLAEPGPFGNQYEMKAKAVKSGMSSKKSKKSSRR